MLPGGSYDVTAHYAGNGTLAASDSTPGIPVTVGKESSLTELRLVTLSASAPPAYNVTTVPYGSPYGLRMDVTNSSGQFCAKQNTGLISYPCPTGSLTVSPAPTEQNPPTGAVPGSYTLNSQGYAEDQFVQQTPGTYNFVASYAGDNSYTASTSPTVPITVTKAPTTTTLGAPSSSVGVYPVVVTVAVSTKSYGVAPTGTVQFLNNGVPLGLPYPILGAPYSPSTGAYASLNTNLNVSLPVGTDSIAVQYSGDANYAGSTSAPASSITITDFSVSANPTTISISAPGQSGTATITITPLYGFTGPMNLTCSTSSSNWGISCSASPQNFSVTGTSPVTATLTVTTTGGSSATPPTPQRRVPPSVRLPLAWPWLLAGLLALVTLVSLAAARRGPAAWLFASALMVLAVGVWVACGGGGGGGGSSSPPAPAPIVSFSTASLTFSQQDTGTTSTAQSVTLSNIGNASLSISNIALGGTNPGDFAQTNNCASSVAAGANCTISVTFTPTAAGSRSASLSITDNASGSPQTVSLTGTGVQPVVTFSPSSLTFGPEGVGLTSPPQTVTLLNTGNSPVTFSGMTTYSGEFNQTNNCPMSVAAGAKCAISVTFTPNGTGVRSALLNVFDNSIGSPQTVSLTGTGTTGPGPYPLYVDAQSGNDIHSVLLSVTVQ